jgi:hypothetical protein
VNTDENPTVTGSHGIQYIPTTILFRDGAEVDRLVGGLSEAALLDYYDLWLGTPDVAPTVSGFTPVSGPVGTSVTVTGSVFTGASAVTFNGSPAATFSLDSDTQITVIVPAGATSGTIAVTTAGGTGASVTNFTVMAPAKPAIVAVRPASARRGATVTITGAGFGAVRGSGSVKIGRSTCTRFLSWSDAKIKCTVPTKAKLGASRVTVTTTAGRSNVMTFRVKR